MIPPAAARRTAQRTTRLQWLVRLTDPLFGGPQTEAAAATGWLWRYLGVTGLVVAVIVVRRSDLLFNPQFFGEDVHAFFSENLLFGFPRALARLYQGFPQLAHRLIALLGGLVPAPFAPRVYASCAVLLTALGLAVFSLPSFRHLVRSDALRIAFCVAVATVPLTSKLEYTLGTVANLGWFVAIWLTLSAVMRVPRSPWRAGAIALAAAGAALSTPLALVNAPLWGLRILRGMIRRDPVEGFFGFAPLLTLTAAVAMTPQLGARTTVMFFTVPVTISVENFVVHATARIAEFVVPPDLLLGAWHSSPARCAGSGSVSARRCSCAPRGSAAAGRRCCWPATASAPRSVSCCTDARP
ncbi:MAG: hypothetical protein ACRERC_19545 [Candidatus Binatia bacterium]